MIFRRVILGCLPMLAACPGDGDSGPGSAAADDDTVVPTAACVAGDGAAEVAEPAMRFNLQGNTGWYSSPAIVDLDGDGDMEIVAPFYDVFVYDHTGATIAMQETDTHHFGRVYMPGVVADLEGDGIVEIVVGGSEGSVAAYEFADGALRIKDGWPARACNSSNCDAVEVRGMSAADLDDDGRIDNAVSTTETDDAGA